MIASLGQGARPAESVGAWAKAARQDTTNGRLAGKTYQRGMFGRALAAVLELAADRARFVRAVVWRCEVAADRAVRRAAFRTERRGRAARPQGPAVELLMACNVGFAGPPVVAAVSEVPVISP